MCGGGGNTVGVGKRCVLVLDLSIISIFEIKSS